MNLWQVGGWFILVECMLCKPVLTSENTHTSKMFPPRTPPRDKKKIKLVTSYLYGVYATWSISILVTLRCFPSLPCLFTPTEYGSHSCLYSYPPTNALFPTANKPFRGYTEEKWERGIACKAVGG